MPSLSRIAAALGALSALLVAGCGDGGPRSFVAQADNAALFVEWTRNDDDLTGTLVQTRLSDEDPTQVETDRVPLRGTVDGENVTLELGSTIGGNNLTGRLDGDTLELTFPGDDGDLQRLEFKEGDQNTYNTAAEQVRQRAADARAEQEEAEAKEADRQAAQEEVDTAAARVSEALNALDSEVVAAEGSIESAGGQIELARSNLDLVRSDIELLEDSSDRCFDAQSVKETAGLVREDLGVLREHLADFRKSAEAARRLGRSAIRRAEALEALGGIPSSQEPLGVADVEAAVAQARRRLANLRRRGREHEAKVQAIATTAESLAARATAGC